MRSLAAALWIVASVTPTVAQTVICFGNEPNWAISVSNPERASVMLPGSLTPREFRGRETRNELIHESVWRGSPTSGGQDVVLFRREAPCSDGMSDKTHPMFARASLPDGTFLVGCCRLDSAPASTTTLEGQPWRLVSLPGQSPATLAALQRPVTVQFDSGRVSGFTGCNTTSGSYTVDGMQLKLGTLAGTMMACPGAASTVESAFNKAFANTLTFVITGDRLNLTTASHHVLSFEREAPQAITGRTWNVTGFNNGRQGVVNPLVGSPISLSFADGRVSGRTGCNTFSGSYTLQGNTIKFGPIAATRMMCAAGVMNQEREFLKALESAVSWTVQGDRLDMHLANGERALEATPEGLGTLSGRTWSVTGFNNGRQGVVSPVAAPISLSFAEGRVSGRSGCNTFNGSYTLAGNTIKFGPIAVTRMMCASNVMTQEGQFLKALESAVRWNVQGDRLDMHRADGERAVEGTPEAAGALAGTWSVTGFNNGRQGVVSPLVGSPISLSFADGRVSGRTGCNTFTGSYSLVGDSIKIGQLANTNMMCAADVMTQEGQFLKALQSAMRWNVQGDRLDMHRADGERALEGKPEAAGALSGTWSVTGFNNGRQGVVSPLVGSPISLSFAEGRVSGRSGCNTFTGSYSLQGNSVSIGQLANTNMMCTADGVMAQESEFLKALQSAVRWSVQGDRLDMHRADGERALEATPEAGATLTGRTWNVTGFNNGGEAVVSPITGTQLTLTFGNGRITGRSGCNTFSAPFTQQGDTIQIRSASTTRRRCMGNVMTQERNFLRALRSAVRWSIQGGELDMHRGDGQRALTASSGS
ncbi:MAG TPA: META domain-containing protein [Pyrinomonadaceae bacterium]|nr:META domain-containing protein [Pyrinomonadaceae bacterium]